MLRLAHVIELLAHPLADLLGDLAGIDGGVHAAMEREDEFELLEIRLHGRLHVWILQLAGKRRTVLGRRPVNLPERRGGRGIEIERAEAPRQSAPSSACMRRLTNAAPMGGASLCSFCSSAAYSGGTRSGMVASSCATFMIGPFRPPSACASAAALGHPPVATEQPRARHRAATPPMLAPTRA